MKVDKRKLVAAWLIWSLLLIVLTAMATEAIAEPERIIKVEYIIMESDQYEETYSPDAIDSDRNLLGDYTVTAYCGCETCCGEWADKRPLDENGNQIVYGAYGIELTPDYSVASPMPEGTRIEIEGLGIHEVEDTTSSWIRDKYEGKIIDLYMGNDEESHQRALEWGKQTLKVWEVE